MDASDAAAVVVAVASTVAVLVLLWAVAALTRTVKALSASIEAFQQEAVPAVAELRSTVRTAGGELERVDALLERAESISATVDAGSRLAYLAFSNPVIKTLAFTAGTGRAVRRFRSRGSMSPRRRPEI